MENLKAFEKHSETSVTVRTPDGKVYKLNRVQDIPLARIMAAKPYLLQDELQLTFETLNEWIVKMAAVITSDKSKLDIQIEASNLLRILKEREQFSKDVITIRIFLAAVVWLFDGEDIVLIDQAIFAEKLRVMQSSEAALSFFLSSEVQELGLLKPTVNLDTLTALHQFLLITEATTALQAVTMTY